MEKLRKLLVYPPVLGSFLFEKLIFTIPVFWRVVGLLGGASPSPVIRSYPTKKNTVIDTFWSQSTVYVPSFHSALQSYLSLRWRFKIHPQFQELTGLYGHHEDEVILDYGCGPGHDLVGFSLYSHARKVIGMDVSAKALALAAHRLALHKVDSERVELIQISDARPEIPLPDQSVDFVSCQGVLMHTTYPEKILAEFFRVLKPNARACIMVYSRPSIWFDLYTAYERMIVNGAFPGLSVEEAFSRNTDGGDCPMSRCYSVDEFVRLCKSAGFECRFAGGYLSETEIISFRRYGQRALADPRLAEQNREFLRALTLEARTRLPMFQGVYAGVSGVYHLIKG